MQIDRGVLSLSGERASAVPDAKQGGNVYSRERLSGRFHRAISLPEDADASKVDASYRDGVLHVRAGRRAAPQPQCIAIR